MANVTARDKLELFLENKRSLKIIQIILKNSLVRKFMGFSFVGVAATLFSMFLTYIFLKKLGFSPYLTYFLSYIISILLSYYLNSRLVFKSEKTIRNLIAYYTVYGISLLIGLGTLYLYRLYLPWDDLILNYLVIPVTLVWNFLVSSKVLKKTE